MNKSVESYIASKTEWANALFLLREIFLSVELKETVKWGIPTYTVNNKNVVAFSAFKSYVGIWFFNGVFLKDTDQKLINAQEGVTRGQRQWRFKSLDEVLENKVLIVRYLEEAIENQKLGKIIKAERKKAIMVPPLLQNAFKDDPGLEQKFNALSPSKQREYCEYLADAKREDTRQRRLEKICPMILKGVGLNDKYKR